MNHPRLIELFKFCKKLSNTFYVVNEYQIHYNFAHIKDFLQNQTSVRMIVEASDAVHPVLDDQLDNVKFLADYFKNSKQSQLIYYSVNFYNVFDNIENIVYRYFPEYHAYYYPIYQGIEIKNSDITKTFLSMNKRVSLERWMLYKKFCTDGLLDQSLFSFLGENRLFGQSQHEESVLKIEQIFQHFAQSHPEFKRFKIPDKMFCQIENDVLLEQYQTGDFIIGNIDPTWKGNELFYQSTFCSVITETTAMTKKPNFSEKTFRALCYGHPFILIGSSGSLAMLRNLGFDTYDDVFDNSYDSEPNREQRILKVFRTIDLIAQQDLCVLNELKKQLLPRRLYNVKKYQELYQKMLDYSAELIKELELLTR